LRRGQKKKAERPHDAKKLDYLEMHLINANISVLREQTLHNELYSTRNRNRIPDLRHPYWNILFEHDTVKVHGELGFENQKTVRRNADYTRAKEPFIVINEDLCKSLNLDQGDVAIYLYYHKLMELKSKEELK